jgi:hypothetical protein
MLGNGSEMLKLSVKGMTGLVCVKVASFTAALCSLSTMHSNLTEMEDSRNDFGRKGVWHGPIVF